MARDRRHRSPWLLVGAFTASLALHPAALFLADALRPTPPPKLYVAVSGRGAGRVVSQPGGIDCGRGKRCASTFERGKRVVLVATVAQGSTFAGWTGDCEVGKWPLQCTVVIKHSTRVKAEFGLVPKRVEVSWAQLPPQPKGPLDITLPDPKQLAALLDVRHRPKIAPRRRKPPKRSKKHPKLAVKAPRPTPIKPTPPPPKPKPKQKKQVRERPNMKSVEVADEEHVVKKAPDDARFLSDKNRDVAVETRARQTNLERARHGRHAASQKSDIHSDKVGGPHQRIAELENTTPSSLSRRRLPPSPHSGTADKAVGVVHGQGGQNGEGGQNGAGSNRKQPGLLSMRGIGGRAPPGGPPDTHTGTGGRPGRAGKRGRFGVRTQLTFNDYKRIFGQQRVKQEVALGRRRSSHRIGRWERRQQAIRSALENFTPEVRPGNQTALRTRAAPFAVYIARMHRRIHPIFAWGFLHELDDKPASFPLNKWTLRTELEIVINPDGTVDKVTIVRPSGQTMFDVGAIDAVYSAGPYEPPPRQLLSANGKVYIHWWFNRDWRECGTFGAHPFILNNPPKGQRDRGPGRAGSGGAGRAGSGARAAAGGADSAGGADRAAAARAAADLPTPDDPRAKRTAHAWLAGFVHGDLARMLAVSATPFHSGGRVVARNAGQLRKVYQRVVSESADRRVEAARLLSPAGYRALFNVLPAGVSEMVPHLLLVLRFGGQQQITLTLSRTGAGAYRVTGLYR